MPDSGWRISVVDSAGLVPGASASLAFRSVGGQVVRAGAQADPTGHGTGVLAVLAPALGASQLLDAQVFPDEGPTTAAAVAAAIDWSVEGGANLLHLSLGLAGDRSWRRPLPTPSGTAWSSWQPRPPAARPVIRRPTAAFWRPAVMLDVHRAKSPGWHRAATPAIPPGRAIGPGAARASGPRG